MIAVEILRAFEKAIKPIVKDIDIHPIGRNRVGNKTPFVLLRKGNEQISDVARRKTRINKAYEIEVLLITETDWVNVIKLQTDIENAIQKIDTSQLTGGKCLEWQSVEVPPAGQSLSAFSFDFANFTGNRQLTLIRYLVHNYQ